MNNIKNSYYFHAIKNEMWRNYTDNEIYSVFICVVDEKKLNIYQYSMKQNYEDAFNKCIDNLYLWSKEAKLFQKYILEQRYIEAAKNAEYTKKFIEYQLKMMKIN